MEEGMHVGNPPLLSEMVPAFRPWLSGGQDVCDPTFRAGALEQCQRSFP
jgi:hypothetical protein